MKRIISHSLILLFLFILMDCGSNEQDKPPVILKGQDPCDNCFMIINETKYSASMKLLNGEEKRFDDIGCMLSFMQRNKGQVKKSWVYDYAGGDPLSTGDAYFIYSDKIITPMGSGIIASNSKSEASELTGKNEAVILSFNELTNNYNKLKMEHK